MLYNSLISLNLFFSLQCGLIYRNYGCRKYIKISIYQWYIIIEIFFSAQISILFVNEIWSFLMVGHFKALADADKTPNKLIKVHIVL